MNWIIPVSEITVSDRSRTGGKGYALAQMHREGIRIPEGICISTEAYREYLISTDMKDRIRMELYRKPFDAMRWEEIWDVSPRIRNMFLKTPLPRVLRERLLLVLESRFQTTPVSVRSSAPGEDSSGTSFAGLHESFVNIRGAELILEGERGSMQSTDFAGMRPHPISIFGPGVGERKSRPGPKPLPQHRFAFIGIYGIER